MLRDFIPGISQANKNPKGREERLLGTIVEYSV
jgi:hypothetical protein